MASITREALFARRDEILAMAEQQRAIHCSKTPIWKDGHVETIEVDQKPSASTIRMRKLRKHMDSARMFFTMRFRNGTTNTTALADCNARHIAEAYVAIRDEDQITKKHYPERTYLTGVTLSKFEKCDAFVLTAKEWI